MNQRTEEEQIMTRWESNRVAVGMEPSGRRRRDLLKESYEIALEMERIGWVRLPRRATQ